MISSKVVEEPQSKAKRPKCDWITIEPWEKKVSKFQSPSCDHNSHNNFRQLSDRWQPLTALYMSGPESYLGFETLRFNHASLMYTAVYFHSTSRTFFSEPAITILSVTRNKFSTKIFWCALLTFTIRSLDT